MSHYVSPLLNPIQWLPITLQMKPPHSPSWWTKLWESSPCLPSFIMLLHQLSFINTDLHIICQTSAPSFSHSFFMLTIPSAQIALPPDPQWLSYAFMSPPQRIVPWLLHKINIILHLFTMLYFCHKGYYKITHMVSSLHLFTDSLFHLGFFYFVQSHGLSA